MTVESRIDAFDGKSEVQPFALKDAPALIEAVFSAQKVSFEAQRERKAGAGLGFRFDGLARTLAELAWNPDNATPFTAVVRGGWGRGKTTLLRQTERLLRETEHGEDRRAVRPIWFNAHSYVV